MKPQRQDRIAALLARAPVASQGELVGLLSGEGIVATQATVSRDLLELGAMKVRLPGGGMAYVIPEADGEAPSAGGPGVSPDKYRGSGVSPGNSARLRRVLQEFVVRIAASGNLAVVRTAPGCAPVVASAIDRSGPGEGAPEVLGTVAGDDTLLVVCAWPDGGAAVAARLAQLSGRAAPETPH